MGTHLQEKVKVAYLYTITHTKEFLDLIKDQRNELSKWTKANGGKKKGVGTLNDGYI